MPIKPIFARKDAEKVRIHRSIIKAATKAKGKKTTQEYLNTLLAEKLGLDNLLSEFEAFKAKPFKFPNRKTGNRYTKK